MGQGETIWQLFSTTTVDDVCTMRIGGGEQESFSGFMMHRPWQPWQTTPTTTNTTDINADFDSSMRKASRRKSAQGQ